MSSIVISGDTSGAVTIAAPAIAGTNTMTLLAATGNLGPKVLSTAVASTSGTAILFTGIPSWVVRITVMFNGVSTSGTSNPLVQIGSGSVTTSGYLGSGGNPSGATYSNYTTGFGVPFANAAILFHGIMTIVNISSNSWVASHSIGASGATSGSFGGGSISLSGALDRVNITTVGGTDTFDAGTINILYE